MASIDIETILDDIQAFLQANLNTKITAINTEKNDAVVLKQIDNDAYFFQTLDEKVANYNPYVFYGIQSIEAEGDGPGAVKQYTLNVVITMCDDQLGTTGKTLLRYSRVLEELFQKNWASIRPSVKLKVQSLEPVAFRLSDSSELYRAVGVELITVIG